MPLYLLFRIAYIHLGIVGGEVGDVADEQTAWHYSDVVQIARCIDSHGVALIEREYARIFFDRKEIDMIHGM